MNQYRSLLIFYSIYKKMSEEFDLPPLPPVLVRQITEYGDDPEWLWKHRDEPELASYIKRAFFDPPAGPPSRHRGPPPSRHSYMSLRTIQEIERARAIKQTISQMKRFVRLRRLERMVRDNPDLYLFSDVIAAYATPHEEARGSGQYEYGFYDSRKSP